MAREGPVVWYLSDVRRFGSSVDVSGFRTLSVIRWLMVVGRPALVGRPTAIAFISCSIWLVGTLGIGRPVTAGFPGADAS